MIIERQSFPYPFTFRTFEMLLKSSPELFIVATHIGKEGREKAVPEVIGYAAAQIYYYEVINGKKPQFHIPLSNRTLLSRHGPTGHIVSIAVHPRHRRRGIGSKLMNELLKLLQDKKCVQVRLEAKVTNEAAHAFYNKFGFQQVGVIPGYYNEKEDATVFVLDWEDIK